MLKDDIVLTLQQKDYFVLKECARNYILSGKSLAEACDHNEKVARRLGKQNVSMLWQFVKIVYSSIPKQIADPFVKTSQNLLTNRMLLATPNVIAQHWTDESLENTIAHTTETNADEYASWDFTIPKINDLSKTINQNGIEDETIDVRNSIVYGEKELTVENMDCIKSLRNGFLYIGPHDLTKNFSWPSDSMMNHDMQQSSRNQALSQNHRDASPVVNHCVRFVHFKTIHYTIYILSINNIVLANRNTERT